MADLDFDALEKAYTAKAKQPSGDDLDFDALERAHATIQSRPVPLTPERQAKVDAQIKATQLQAPSGARTLYDAFRESNQQVGQDLSDKTLLGIPGRVMRATGTYGDPVQPIPQPGQGGAHRPEDYLPTEGTLSGVPAAAIDTATIGGAFGRAGQAIGQAPASLARSLGARAGQTAVRPSIQAAADAVGTGALYSGAETAARGGSPSDVLQSMPEGGAAGLAFSALPSLANSADNFLTKRVVANDLRPIKQMSKKGTLDKELIQFGNGDPEEGARKMAEFVQRENLGPALRQKGSAAVSQFEAAKEKAYNDGLRPIYEHAYAAEPDASVKFDEIAERLRANIRKKGGNEHRLVEKAIDEIKARTELVGKSGDVPLETLLTNARDFQSAGHAGVVNYDDPPESKVVMRQVGHALRTMANERVAAIYTRHPEAAQELFTRQAQEPMGMTNRDQPSTPGMVRAEDYPNAWARRYENAQEYAQDVPRLLSEGNKRYSDYAKMEPLVRQASVQKAGEKKYGLMSLLGHGLGDTAAGVAGYALGGVPGAIGATAALEAGRAAYPYALRGGQGLSAGLGGTPVGAPSGLAGALALRPWEDRRD
jgi:hypothetical protein